MNKSMRKNLPALILILFGVGFFLDTVEIVDFTGLLATWWPLVLIGFGLHGLLTNQKSLAWPLLLLALGLLFQMRALDMITFSIWGLAWPIALIGIGIALLSNNDQSPPKPKKK